MMTTKKITLLSVMTALGVVLNWFENLIFPWSLLPIPGVKIGLANVVFLIVLLIAGFRIAMLLSIFRVLVLNLMTGTLATPILPLSAGGALVSLILMAIGHKLAKGKFSLIGLSIMGAAGHNLGQLVVLALIPGLLPGFVATYLLLPGLLALSIPAGMITGWVTQQVFPTVEREWRV